MVAASTVLGAAGEHYVMSVLLRHGFIAASAGRRPQLRHCFD